MLKDDEQKVMDWIAAQHDAMVDLATEWSSINSGSENLDGLEAMLKAVKSRFEPLDVSATTIPVEPRYKIDSAGNEVAVPLGRALSLTKRPDADLQVLLCGHLDTVFGIDHPFQTVTELDSNTLNGPGITDLKGGLVLMATALEACEVHGACSNIGWQVLLNADEEVGSPGSAPLLASSAKGKTVGLIFEPSLADGTFVSARLGSAYYTVVAHGRGAHAGRDYASGRSALNAIARVLIAAEKLNSDRLIVNTGSIEGGGPCNVVPSFALCRINIRIADASDADNFAQDLQAIVEEIAGDGITLEVHGALSRPPKPFDEPTQQLFEAIKTCGSELGLSAKWKPGGGVCDGNNFAAAGLPTIDTLGVRGGGIHTTDEYILLDSLVERAQLVALFLMRLAKGEITIEKPASTRT